MAALENTWFLESTLETPAPVRRVAISADGAAHALALADGRILLAFQESGSGPTGQREFTGDGEVLSLDLAVLGRRILVTTTESVTLLAPGGEGLLQVPTGGQPTRTALSTDGGVVAIQTADALFGVNHRGQSLFQKSASDLFLDKMAGPTVRAAPGSDDGIPVDVALDARGRRVAVCDRTGAVCLMDGGGDVLWRYLSDAPYAAIRLSCDGSLITVLATDGALTALSAQQEFLFRRGLARSPAGRIRYDLAGLSRETFVAVSGQMALILDAAGKTVHHAPISVPVVDIAVDGKGRRVLVLDESGRVHDYRFGPATLSPFRYLEMPGHGGSTRAADPPDSPSGDVRRLFRHLEF